MPGPLQGRHVLVPRPDPADPLAAAVRAAGGRPLCTELVRTFPAEPATGLDAALRALAGGTHDWLAVTSARTVPVLADRAGRLGQRLAEAVGDTRVAAVGPATARALQERGVPVHLHPPGPASAEDLLAVWPPLPPAGGSVLTPRSAIAAPTLVRGLRALGWRVSDVVAYRTTTVPDPDPAVAQALARGTLDLVLLTSGSTATALVELYGPPGTPVCAIGTSTARAAADLGLPVAAVATEQTPEGLVAAAARALSAPTRTESPR